ncbi:MAG: LysR family transcriptional regulator [Pseudomonadota bacterium]
MLTPPRPAAAPLNALRALEAAGRHGSFLRAAEELNVTPGAIAQQIKKLETWAGVDLFERHPQGVALTPLGLRLMPSLEEAFLALGTVSQRLRHAGERAEIRIAALPAIAQLWLTPRMTDLRRQVPDADFAIHALDAVPTLKRGEFDLAIYPMNMLTDMDPAPQILCENLLAPVAAPELAATIRSVEDLESATLIHDLAWREDWQTWFNGQNLEHAAPGRGPAHSLYSMAVERCIAGDGLMIGHTALIQQHLNSGTLLRVFPASEVPWHALCLVRSSVNPPDRRIDAIIAELHNDRSAR